MGTPYYHTSHVKISDKLKKGNPWLHQEIARLEAEKAQLFEGLRTTHPHEALRRNYRAQLIVLERELWWFRNRANPFTYGSKGGPYGERMRRARALVAGLLAVHRAAGRSYQIFPRLLHLVWASPLGNSRIRNKIIYLDLIE